MKRGYKITIWILSICTTIGIGLVALFNWSLARSAPDEIIAREMSAQEISTGFNSFNSKIKIKAGFKASEYGGWHGDGGSVKIYLIDAIRVDDFLASRESRRRPNSIEDAYEWHSSSRPDLSSLNYLLPEKFKPPEDNYIIGRSFDRSHTISIGKKSGYVCFSTSRT